MSAIDERTDMALAHISQAERALAMAETPTEAAEVADLAEAARVYAKRSGATIPVINKAVRLKLTAERKAGEMLGRMEKAKNRHSSANTLSALGITDAQSSRWQRAAMVPEVEFAEYIKRCDDEGKEITTAGLYKLAIKLNPKNGARKPEVAEGIYADWSQVQALGVKFGTIYADPPWRYQNQGTRASTDNHYDGSLSVDELCAMPVGDVAADKSHLHLWTTNAFLFECPRIMDAWGFEYKSTFVWVKRQMGIGNYWRNSHEIMLLGVKGGLTAASKAEMSWIECGRGAHSSKPMQVRERIERLSPGPRLEMFGRRPVKDWVVFGNQIVEELL